MLYCLATIVNRYREFKTAINQAGVLGVYDEMTPSYAIFCEDTESFCELWTPYVAGVEAFCAAYAEDVRRYGGGSGKTAGKPNAPENVFTVSMMPWASFEGFNLNLQKGYDYLKPIFTMGKYYEEGQKILLPLAIQVHHAVCDGFHICRFVNELQELINNQCVN